MSGRLAILNRQIAAPVEVRLLRRLVRILLNDLLEQNEFALGICLIDSREMARLNETFLKHKGSTDVITFDYSRAPSPSPSVARRRRMPNDVLEGEIFICMDEAITHAFRFRTTWQKELARYVVHGVLHLCHYDDLRPQDRREMKREENRLLRELDRSLSLQNLERSRSAPRRVRASKRHSQIRQRFPLS